MPDVERQMTEERHGGLQTALETVAAAYARGTLEKDARTISEAYRLKTGEGRRLLTRKSEAAAYALSRMPATVEAAKAALTPRRWRRRDLRPKPCWTAARVRAR